MKRFLLTLCVLVPALLHGQTSFYEPFHVDSVKVNFSAISTFPASIRPDTAASPLWQLGDTHKALFAPGISAVHGLMTDTTGDYPASADNFFTFVMPSFPNPIIEVFHRYSTTAGHDGGVIEFSFDSGATWKNIVACDNIPKTNVYTATDTLAGGTGAFSGTSAGTVKSRFQFIDCIGAKTTITGCFFGPGEINRLLVRFRFISDASAESLPGWMIDSIRVYNPLCIPGSVSDVHAASTLPVTPNPSYDGRFTFPALEQEAGYSLEVYNTLGQRLYAGRYQRQLDLSAYAGGLYWYTVYNAEERFTGRLLKQ